MSKVTVNATGSACAEYDLVTYKTETVSKPFSSGPEAKKYIESICNQITKYVRWLIAEGAATSHKYSLTVSPVTEYDSGLREQVFKGYKAKFSMEFTSEKVNEVSSVQDVLTSYDCTQAYAPVFSVKNKEALESAAEKNAWAKVKARFTSQHSTIFPQGNILDWEVTSWNARFEKAFSKVAAPTEDSQSGVIQSDCYLDVVFSRKGSKPHPEDDGC